MPPSLALLLCTAFVLFLLDLERRGARDVSAAIWIPTVWIMIAATGRPLETWLTGAQPIAQRVYIAANNQSGSTMDRWTLTALAVLGIIIIVGRRFKWLGALHRQGWLIVLLAYMLLSTFWSEITVIALKRWAREWIAIVMALLMMSEAHPLEALASLLRRCAYVLLPFSVVLIRYYPALGRQYSRWSGVQMWTGVTGQKNELGRLCMISVFFLLMALYQRWHGGSLAGGRYQAWGDASIIVIGVYLLIGSSSATSLATLMVGVATFFGLRWFKQLRSSVGQIGLQALVVFLIAFGAAVPFLGGSNVAAFSSVLGRDQTLTGRTDVWAEVMPARDRQPLLGYGFGSFWTDARRELYDIPTAHNGYLDVLLEVGEVGLVFYTAWLLSCTRQLHRALLLDHAWASFGICLLLMSLIYNITESALNSTTDYITAVVILGCLVVPAGFGSRSASAPGSIEPERPALAVGRW
jgi:exopolysaccharide production protein ExoQ